MGHCIQVIVAPESAAGLIARRWPELLRWNLSNGIAVFPVDAELIDNRLAPAATPDSTPVEFMLLTGAFREFLATLSRDGLLAYVETDYFGGVGGQGALVCRDGTEIMPPTWKQSGTINEALRFLGVNRGKSEDEFAAVGFRLVRHNDKILTLIAAGNENK